MAFIKKTLIISLTLLTLLLVGCQVSDHTDHDNGVEEQPKEENPVEKEISYRVFNGSDQLVSETNKIWNAIIEAGTSSKNQDRFYVLDKNDDIVYKYSLVNYYKYIGEIYIGETNNKEEAIQWAKGFPNAYVIDGKASEFVALGEEKIPANSTFTRGYELYTGSYAYLFSKKYSELKDQVGYAYMSFTLRFSEATITYPKESTENGWNAYVFVNNMMDSPWSNNDMGIMNGWESHKGQWLPVFNLNGNTFNPQQGAVITEMELLDPKTDTWGNADDLFFELYSTDKEYVMKIKNLTTSEQFVFTAVSDKLANNAHKTYLLLAASFVPVLNETKVWNPRSGATFENIIFEDVKVAQYLSSDDYTDAIRFDYGPGKESTAYTLLQGADNVIISYGTHLKDGVYPNGGKFIEGTKFIQTSIFYDNRNRD